MSDTKTAKKTTKAKSTKSAANRDSANKTKAATKKRTTTKSKARTKPLENHTFQAETKQLLNLMIHSLYTHNEIFLRELISNASDALDKVRFAALTNADLLNNDEQLEIWLEINKDNKTLSISDNGIGMNRQEVIDNIGTIAQSGSKAFLKALEAKSEDERVELIGQFGVGFYSSFMVAKKVELVTRAAGEETATYWVSEGEGTYKLGEAKREKRGSTITLHLRDDLIDPDRPEEDYLNQYTIQNMVKRYSDYIRYPIKMNFVTDVYPKGEDGQPDYQAEPTKKVDVRTLNSMKPLWHRNKSEIDPDEYNQFFKHQFHDWNEPMEIIHTKAEGNVEYTALLFIPSKAAGNFYSAEYDKGIHLYAKQVFVMDRCKDLFPDHLRFVRGLVDSPDFSLNISREILQNDRQIKLIAKNLEKKVMDTLKKMLKKERKKFEEWWEEFGKAIKGGIYMQYDNKNKLQDLLLFPSSHAGDGMTTLAEYVSRMPEDQKNIYYMVGKSKEAIERSPQMEVIRDKGIEVLYFTDKVDEFLTQNMHDYDDKPLKSVARGELDLEDKKDEDKDPENKDKPDEKKEEEKQEEAHKELLEAIGKALGDKVKEVRLSKRLKRSAVCLVNPEHGPSFNMEMLLQGTPGQMGRAQRIMELNPDHQIFGILSKAYDKDPETHLVGEFSELLFAQAMLIEGYTLEDPVTFANRLNELMVSVKEDAEA